MPRSASRGRRRVPGDRRPCRPRPPPHGAGASPRRRPTRDDHAPPGPAHRHRRHRQGPRRRRRASVPFLRALTWAVSCGGDLRIGGTDGAVARHRASSIRSSAVRSATPAPRRRHRHLRPALAHRRGADGRSRHHLLDPPPAAGVHRARRRHRARAHAGAGRGARQAGAPLRAARSRPQLLAALRRRDRVPRAGAVDRSASWTPRRACASASRPARHRRSARHDRSRSPPTTAGGWPRARPASSPSSVSVSVIIGLLMANGLPRAEAVHQEEAARGP